ncbi:UNVERIFIED_CONTAM: hypothetical protein K2H54_019607 [Gekko kuhli]
MCHWAPARLAEPQGDVPEAPDASLARSSPGQRMLDDPLHDDPVGQATSRADSVRTIQIPLSSLAPCLSSLFNTLPTDEDE